ncbi:hypothetical protein BT63DRAFT_409297 [Microthyrium microscopicum]|uniref:Uncharacterized protein n=1 Tax=Microthyrium microscopicum TaxID=703497 RepID=A0A6A6UUU0_9PEZI|nr:hypothetical protein BT63DRAFT_409297 [Microthyrium microscopicum]
MRARKVGRNQRLSTSGNERVPDSKRAKASDQSNLDNHEVPNCQVQGGRYVFGEGSWLSRKQRVGPSTRSAMIIDQYINCDDQTPQLWAISCPITSMLLKVSVRRKSFDDYAYWQEVQVVTHELVSAVGSLQNPNPGPRAISRADVDVVIVS